MGKPKHGVNSARTKKCKKYLAENRLERNKNIKTEKLKAGKKIKSKKLPKTRWTRFDNLIRNTQQSVPCFDPVLQMVLWGTDKNKEQNKM